MRITRRQQHQITGILDESASEIRELHDEMYKKRRTSLLAESELYESMSPDDVETALERDLSQDVVVMGQKVLSDIDKLLYKNLAELLAQAGAEKVSGSVLMDDLEDFDADGLMLAQQQMVVDVAEALHSYIKEVALIATHAKLMGVESDES